MANPPSIPRSGLTVSERQALLFAGDLLCVLLAVGAAWILWMGLDHTLSDPIKFFRTRDAITPFLWLGPLWFFLISHLYDPHAAFSRERTLFGLGVATAISLVPYLVLYFFATPGSLPRAGIVVYLLVLTGLEFGWRMLAIRLFTLPMLQRPTLIIGAGRAGTGIIRVLTRDVPGHFRVQGLVDDDPEKRRTKLNDIPILGGWQVLRDVVCGQGISVLVLAITGKIRPELFQAILDCQEMGVEVIRMPALYESLLGRVPIEYLSADWLLTSFLDSVNLYDLYSPLKRLLDILISLMGMAIGLILFPILAVIIRMDSPGPILYQQERSGKGGHPIGVWKYRTMVRNAEPNGEVRWASPEDPRVTRVGKWMRRTRLDEIPQFWNVLRGDMSLIGPRPERPEWIAQLEKQIPFYRARLLVQPGLTGWSQVNYGYVRTVEDTALKLEYDLYYIRHRSPILDLKILLRTMGTLIRFQGS
ncbi:MAG: sugar transferase [Anaerolineales bacterium]|jgi:exopolysaccharide biosynthesis polyprenyl glycosylphosphotransferase